MQHNDARFLELLQRWQSGDFTRADEQELYALAASDDFRREAMEGFMTLPETAHDERLATLRTRLLHRGGGGRLVALPQILAAAAVLVLLIAAIWFLPNWNEKNAAPEAQTQVVSAEKIPATTLDSIPESPVNQYIVGASPSEVPVPSATGTSRPPATDQAFSTSGAGDFVASEEAESVAADDSEPVDVLVPPKAPNAAPVRAQPQNEIPDKIVSEAKKDRVVESVSNRPEQLANAKKSKAAGRAKDSTWHETDRKPDMKAEKKAAREADQTDESEPEGGWEAFSEYLRQNARLTPEARNHNVSGTVQLQFNLNSNGDPQGFIVLRSVGYGCDQEAIRLVQNWEWARGRNPIVTVEVPFVR